VTNSQAQDKKKDDEKDAGAPELSSLSLSSLFFGRGHFNTFKKDDTHTTVVDRSLVNRAALVRGKVQEG